jgi:hypothetical protein
MRRAGWNVSSTCSTLQNVVHSQNLLMVQPVMFLAWDQLLVQNRLLCKWPTIGDKSCEGRSCGEEKACSMASAGGRIEIELPAAGSGRYGKIVFLPCAAEMA